MKRNIYNLLSAASHKFAGITPVTFSKASGCNAKQWQDRLHKSVRACMLVFVFTLLSAVTQAQAVYTFTYTGGIQNLNLQAGSYSIQCWGAIGGWHTSDPNLYRGKGGYSVGKLTLTAPTNVYIAVGGAGGVQTSNSVPGGYNGGGNGKYYSYAFNGGGGASHVATATGILSSLATNTNAVIIVAGGGGGGSSAQTPGNGGGLTGGNSTRSGCTGGTQTLPGASSITGGNAAFGLGWDASLSGGSYGGGGGGWYGGGPESGGSSYIGGVTSATTIMFGQSGYVANPDVNGDGWVIITELCSIKLLASSSGSANPATLCSGTSLTITTDAISNYSWSTGATTNSIVVAPTTNTVYSLTAMSPSNCMTTANLSVIVSAGVPVMTLAATPSSVCIGDSIKLNATGAVTYTWSNGVSNNQLFPPPQTTTYVVTGKNGCGTSTAAITVSAIPLPVTIASSTNTTCSGSPVTLTVTGGSTYTWSTNQTSSVIVVAPASQTTYTVSGKKGSCQNTSSITIFTNPLPNIQLAGTSTNVCAGTTVTLTASGGSNSYTWTPSTLSGTVVTDTPTSSVNYQVTGSNGFGCKSTGNHLVLVSPLPTITVNAPQPIICPGATITLMATGGHTYQWNTGAQTKSLVVNPSATTSYTVVGTFTDTGCNDEAYFTVNVDQPTLSLSPSQTVCPGTAVTMSANGSAHNWSNGGTSVFNSVTVTTPTMYTVSSKVLTANNLLCVGSGTINLGMHPQPVVVATATRSSICKNEKTVITASGADTYSWQGTNVNGPTRTFSSNVVTTHTVSVIGTDVNGCMDTAQVTVKVNACTGLAESSLSEISIYPNPSAGTFNIKSENDQVVHVLNELGQLMRVIELNGQNQHQVQISGLPKGIYFIQSVPDATSNGSLKQKLIVE